LCLYAKHDKNASSSRKSWFASQKPLLITLLYSRTRQNTINQVKQITNQTTQQSVQHWALSLRLFFTYKVTLAVTSRREKTQNSFTCWEVMEGEGKREERKWAITWEGFVQELKKAGCIAAPMVAVSVLQYLLQVVSVIIVGHLGALALSSAAIATSITNVTGFSLLVCLLILSLFVIFFFIKVLWSSCIFQLAWIIMLSIQKLRLLSLPLRREEEDACSSRIHFIYPGIEDRIWSGEGKKKKENNPLRSLSSFGLTPKSYVSCTEILNLSFKHISFHTNKIFFSSIFYLSTCIFSNIFDPSCLWVSLQCIA